MHLMIATRQCKTWTFNLMYCNHFVGKVQNQSKFITHFYNLKGGGNRYWQGNERRIQRRFAIIFLAHFLLQEHLLVEKTPLINCRHTPFVFFEHRLLSKSRHESHLKHEKLTQNFRQKCTEKYNHNIDLYPELVS